MFDMESDLEGLLSLVCFDVHFESSYSNLQIRIRQVNGHLIKNRDILVILHVLLILSNYVTTFYLFL